MIYIVYNNIRNFFVILTNTDTPADLDIVSTAFVSKKSIGVNK